MAIDPFDFAQGRLSIALPCSRFAVRSVARRPQSDGYSPTAPTFSKLLLIVPDHLRCRFTQFKLVANFLDLRGLLLQARSEHFDLLLLLRELGLKVVLLLLHRRF